MAAALEIHYAQEPSALEIVGEHYRLAGDAGRAYRYLVAAARRLAERSLTQEAWDLTEKAGTLEDSAMGDLPPVEFRQFRRDNLAVRAGVLYNRAEWSEAEKTWRAVLSMAEEDGDPRGVCEAWLQLATVLRRRARHEESGRFAEQALEASRRLHYREGVADALHCMAALAWANGNLDECERMANEGLLVAQGSQLADRRAELLLALTAAQATKGQLASATSGLAEAEQIFREVRMKRPRCLALANIAELLTWQGEPLQARQRAHVAVQLAIELDYKLGRSAAQRAMGVAAIDLGLYEEAQSSLLEAHAIATEIDLAEEILACLVALTHLAVERGEHRSAVQHGLMGLEAGRKRDPERYLPLLQGWLATAHGQLGEQTVARGMIGSAEARLSEIPIPRRTQVQLALTWALVAVGDADAARTMARTVLQTAGSRGFRLVSLEARALMAHLTNGAEQLTHRQAGRDLARDFASGLAPEMAKAFWRRPFVKLLGE
jgi:tetratricopeptide (TPR) repeat protein